MFDCLEGATPAHRPRPPRPFKRRRAGSATGSSRTPAAPSRPLCHPVLLAWPLIPVLGDQLPQVAPRELVRASSSGSGSTNYSSPRDPHVGTIRSPGRLIFNHRPVAPPTIRRAAARGADLRHLSPVRPIIVQ